MIAHIIETVLYLGVGALIAVFGLLIWKKQKLSLLHDYHYKNVKPEDAAAYAKQMGIGQILIGAGLCLTGVLRLFTDSWFAWTGLVLGLVCGVWVIHKAQMKFNGSWMS